MYEIAGQIQLLVISDVGGHLSGIVATDGSWHREAAMTSSFQAIQETQLESVRPSR